MDAMRAEMTTRQMAEWEAFYLLEPWGSAIDDHRAGTVAMTIANVNRGKGTRPFTSADFFPSRIPKRTEPKTADEVREQVMAIFGPMAGVNRG